MDWLWTWGGESFGYRREDRLFAYHGVQAGHFDGDEVYGSDGHYLGEVMNENRLITHKGKKGWRKSGFAPVLGGSYARYANYAGYEDFPSPDEFRR